MDDHISEKLILDVQDLSSRIREGTAALFPTDTLPALGACPAYSHKLWSLKKRPKQKPLILMGDSSEQLLEFVQPCAVQDARSVTRDYWPGALTLILPFLEGYIDQLNPGATTMGMRVPDCAMTQDLLKKTGPLATTSANISGEPSSLTAISASSYFPDLPLLGPLPWPKCSGLGSTLISWKSIGSWQIIRRGAVIPEEILS